MLKQNFLFDLEKLSKYWASTVNVLSLNPCVGSLPKIKIFFSYYQYKQMSSYKLQK